MPNRAMTMTGPMLDSLVEDGCESSLFGHGRLSVQIENRGQLPCRVFEGIN